jgi:hypothetical protein
VKIGLSKLLEEEILRIFENGFVRSHVDLTRRNRIMEISA